MTDEQNREPFSPLPPQLVQKRQDLLLNGHVQRGSGFVADEEHRLYGERPRDRRALALSAADLVRISHCEIGRQSALRQKPGDLSFDLFPGYPAVYEALANAVSQRASRVKRLRRRLEHHLHFAVSAAERSASCLGDVLAVQDDRALCRIQQAGDHARHGALPAAALADDPQAFPSMQREAHVVDRGEVRAALSCEDLCQVVYCEYRVHTNPPMQPLRAHLTSRGTAAISRFV